MSLQTAPGATPPPGMLKELADQRVAVEITRNRLFLDPGPHIPRDACDAELSLHRAASLGIHRIWIPPSPMDVNPMPRCRQGPEGQSPSSAGFGPPWRRASRAGSS